ncbi:tetratricopeptide repeat protein [bacterium]|nr:tetratricopeptide repeat protein [bacterium]
MKRRLYGILTVFCLSGTLAAQNVERIASLIQRGEIARARAEVETLSDTDKPGEKLFLRGLLATDGLEAETLYEQLCRTYPDYDNCDFARFRLAQLKYARGLYISAKTEFERLITSYPESRYIPQSHYWIGRCLQALGDDDAAVGWFEKASDASFSGPETARMAESALDSLKRSPAAPAPERLSRDGEQREAARESWTVQVGAFSRRQHAILRKSFFEQRGYEVRLGSKERDGQTLYLVWIGEFDNRQSAWNFGEALKKKYDTPFTLVQH